MLIDMHPLVQAFYGYLKIALVVAVIVLIIKFVTRNDKED